MLPGWMASEHRTAAVQVQYVLNKDKAMLPKSDNKNKFDGIQLVVEGAERCDIPRRFACCKKCYAAAQTAEISNETCRLPKQVTTLDLDMQDCLRCGPSMVDKVRLFSVLLGPVGLFLGPALLSEYVMEAWLFMCMGI